jgi:hypothetical protein
MIPMTADLWVKLITAALFAGGPVAAAWIRAKYGRRSGGDQPDRPPAREQPEPAED